MQVEPTTEARLRMAEVYLVPSADGALTLRAQRRSAVLKGRLVTEIFPLLIPLLDGTRTRTEIARELSSTVAEPALFGAMDRLAEYGMIEEVDTHFDAWPDSLRDRIPTQLRLWSQYGADSASLSRITTSTVAVVGDGPLVPAAVLSLAASGLGSVLMIGRRQINEADVAQNALLRSEDVGSLYGDAARRLIAESGLMTNVAEAEMPDTVLRWKSTLREVDAALVVTDLPVVFSSWLGDINLAMLDLGRPWTVATLLQRATAHVGPSVIPQQTPCWKCFELRFKSNLDSVDRYQEFEVFVQDRVEYANAGGLPSITSYVAGVATMEAIRLLMSDTVSVRTAGRLLTIDLWDYAMELHTVLKLPRCAHCSPTSLVPQERIWS
ncbi:MAG: TOMM precursor leader peptide-binding protein [Microthrixaceae bacterium]|nr:TOMM precursor leader peptide-binding protein [Microthrixaceae bacterium]